MIATAQALPTIQPDPEHSTEFVRAWRAWSRRHAHIAYVVRYDRLDNAFDCQCPSYFYRGTCSHIDQAINTLVAEWRQKRKVGAA